VDQHDNDATPRRKGGGRKEQLSWISENVTDGNGEEDEQEGQNGRGDGRDTEESRPSNTAIAADTDNDDAREKMSMPEEEHSVWH